MPGLKLLRDVETSGRPVLIWGSILWSIVAVAAYYSDPHGRIALGAGVVLASLLFAAALKWGQSLARGLASRWPRVQQVAGVVLEGDWPRTAVIVVPLGSLAIALMYANGNYPLLVAGTVAGVLMAGMWLLKRKAGEAISGRVMGASKIAVAPAAVATTAGAGTAATTPSKAAPPPATLSFDIEIVKPPDLAQLSENIRGRLHAIRERGPQVRRLYRRSAFLLSAGSMAAALAAWWLLEARHDLGSFPWFSAVLFLATLMIIAERRSENSTSAPIFKIARYTLRYLRGGAAQERNRWEHQIKPIRPVVAPMLGVAWTVFTLLRALTYLNGPSPAKWIPVGISGVVVSWYSLRLRRGRKALESQFPVYPALNLLALRVFGSPSRDLFVDLLDLWHWVGPLYRLDGPDTVGDKSSAVLAYVTGHLDEAVTKDRAALETAVRNFTQTRDSQLRFAFNSLQCNDVIWRDALQSMLDRADVVVMDLSGLTEKNRGCRYEIAKMVTEVPLERFLMLVDDDTDIDFLRRLLSEATIGRQPADARARLRLFHLGTQPKRKANESVYEWQGRTTTPIDADRLVGLLLDAACAKRPAQSPIVIPWTRPGYRSAPFA